MKALVLFSGGLDSTTCLAEAVNKYGSENVIALSMYYGQKHNREIESAKSVINYYGVSWKQLNLEDIFSDSNCSLLNHSTEDVPEESYDEQLKKTNGKPVSTYVPFRNGLFLSCASSIAISNGCEVIYYGIHKDDAAGNAYPDCSVMFSEYMNKAVKEGTGNAVELYAPFVNKTKAQIVKRGLELKVPYELTWSCYEGNEKPCCKCGTCLDRIEAFRLNNATDPLLN